MKPKVLYEDKTILVLDKPSGWIVNEATTTGNSPVVQTWLRKNFKYPLIGNRNARDGIVHRLDKETSGILIISKTADAFENLQRQFKERTVEKKYLALVHGRVEPSDGEIKTTVSRLPWNRKRFGVLPGGREAVTHYRVISNFQFPITNEKYTLLELKPKTGRTHQIRIHLKYLRYPIVSDEFYTGRKTAKKDRLWCPRLFLHSYEISFDHPLMKNNLHFKSEVPKDLNRVLASLEKVSETP